MRKVKTESKVFSTKEARNLTPEEVDKIYKKILLCDGGRTVQEFAQDLEALIKDYNLGAREFSNYLNPAQKINILENIKEGCELIICNLKFIKHDHHLSDSFKNEKLKEVEIFKNIFQYPYSKFIYSVGLIYILEKILPPMKEYIENQIADYSKERTSKGNKKDLFKMFQENVINLILDYDKESRIVSDLYCENDSRMALHYESLDQLELALYYICKFALDIEISISEESNDEASQSRIRKIIKKVALQHIKIKS